LFPPLQIGVAPLHDALHPADPSLPPSIPNASSPPPSLFDDESAELPASPSDDEDTVRSSIPKI
jgi:hypothetical protein